MKADEISENFMVFNFAFIQFQCTSLTFAFVFCAFKKLTTKFGSFFEMIQNFEISDLAVAKVKKVNIAVT
jgi:hypothetical protein